MRSNRGVRALTIIVLMNLDDVDIDTIVFGVANLHLPQAEPAGVR
jgi:hypothetical protein